MPVDLSIKTGEGAIVVKRKFDVHRAAARRVQKREQSNCHQRRERLLQPNLLGPTLVSVQWYEFMQCWMTIQ